MTIRDRDICHNCHLYCMASHLDKEILLLRTVWLLVCETTIDLLVPIRQFRHDMTKPTKWGCAQRRLRSAWASESSLCAQWVAKAPSFLHADSEDSDQTGRMPRLIWVFAWRTLILLVLSCRGSFIVHYFLCSMESYYQRNSDILAFLCNTLIILDKIYSWSFLLQFIGTTFTLREHSAKVL